MQRRTWLKLGLVSAAVLAVGGGSLALLQPGVDGGRLTPAARAVMAAVGNAMLDGSLPTDPAARKAAIDGLLARTDTLVAGLPPHAQAELSQLLALLASAAGRRALAGLSAPWPEASVVQVQQAFADMRGSGISLRLQAYQALHDIAAGAYFSDPSTWSLLGYPGPTPI